MATQAPLLHLVPGIRRLSRAALREGRAVFDDDDKDYLDGQDDATVWDREEYLEVLGIEPEDDWDDGGSSDDERLAWSALYDDDLPEEDEYEDFEYEDFEDDGENEGEEDDGAEALDDEYTPPVPVSPEMPMPCDFLDEGDIPF